MQAVDWLSRTLQMGHQEMLKLSSLAALTHSTDTYKPQRVLHRLLLHPNNTGYNLRQRAHILTLPSDVNSTTKQNFIFRMLFDAMCWLLNSIISHVLYFVYFVWVSLNFYLLHTALVICALKNYLLTYMLSIIANASSALCAVVSQENDRI